MDKDFSKPFVLQCIIPEGQAASFDAVKEILAKYNLSPDSLNTIQKDLFHFAQAEVEFSNREHFSRVKADLFSLSFAEFFNIALQPNVVFSTAKKLIVFDMDSTLIRQEVIDEIADYAGLKAKVSAITERAMRGELDFNASLRERVALLEGIPESEFANIQSRLQVTDGVAELLSVLKDKGALSAVISGGFTPFTGYMKDKLDLDYHFANVLEVENGKLTGRTTGRVVNREVKRELVLELMEKHHLRAEEVMVAGDGANDLDMMDAAGLSVAFNAKPAVRQKADASIVTPRLDMILFFIGAGSEFRG